MHLSELLLEKLNSDAEFLKRIQLAKNVFICRDLRIPYKEENIILWFLKQLLDANNEDKKEYILEGLCFCVASENMTLIPSSGIRISAKSSIVNYLTKIIKSPEPLNIDLFQCILTIITKFIIYFKSHPIQYVKLISTILHKQLSATQYGDVLNLTSKIYKSGIFHEKFVTHLLKGNFHILFKNLDSSDDKGKILIQFLQKMFFKKEVMTQFQITIHSICSSGNIIINNTLIQMILKELHGIYTSELDINVKEEAFCRVFQSFAKACGSENSVSVLQCFITLCHIVGVEQHVTLKSSNSTKKQVVSKEEFTKSFNVLPSSPSDASFVIAKALIDSLRDDRTDLNAELLDSTYLAWFQSLVSSTVKMGELSSVHLDFFCSCAEFNTYIVEKNFSKIFASILSLPRETLDNSDFVLSCSQFLENTLRMYSKLQRVQKFTSRMLKVAAETNSVLTSKCLISDEFVSEYSNIVTMFPSKQSLPIMDDILNVLEHHCLENLEQCSGTVNTLLMQITCALLSACLSGIRVLNHTTPRGIVTLFVEKFHKLKVILGRIGKALLVRIHDREIVQPFLSLCFHWGEFELLIMYYDDSHSEALVNKTISPTDLSVVHSYLSGEEWNVLAERVSNFGAAQCYQLFLKLILQKLRTLHLKKCHSLINGETTSKYILSQLTSELYKHNIVEELTPEDLRNILTYLTEKQSYLIIDKLYDRAFDVEYSQKLLDWVKDSTLLESEKFVVLSLKVIFRKVSMRIKDAAEKSGALDDPLRCRPLEFAKDDYSVDDDSVSKLVDDFNSLLFAGSGALTDSSVNAEQLSVCVELLKCLPLKYLSHGVRSFAIVALMFLTYYFSNIEELFNPLLVLTYNLGLNSNKENLYPDINKGLCIRWLYRTSSASEKVQALKYNFVKYLLKLSTFTDNGLEELNQLVRFMKKQKQENGSKTFEHQMLLYEDLGKCWFKTRKRQHDNEKISTYRKKLWKCIQKELQRQNELKDQTIDSEVLIKAYGVELTRAIKLKKEESIVNLIKLNFNEYVDSAVDKVKNRSTNKEVYITFLTGVVLHMPQIRSHVSDRTLKKIWGALKSQSEVDWNFFGSIATDEEFKFFMMDLVKMWKDFLVQKTMELNLQIYFTIWMKFFKCESSSKMKLYQICLDRLFDQFSVTASKLSELSSMEMVQLFKFLQFCIATNRIILTSAVLDVFFDVFQCYDYKATLSIREFQEIFESCIDASSLLLTTRAISVKDKIHNFFQLFQKLLDVLVRRSSSTAALEEEDLLILSSCSHNMEKWTSKMVKWDKDFSRVSVYFIGEIVSSFVKVTIYPVVKDPLVNCIKNFLRISDSHNIAHLERALHPGSRQVFNKIYETYKKYYMFTGKV